MVEPRGCVEMGCRFLYSVVDGLTGIQYVGCMQEVFGAKVESTRSCSRAASAASR